MIFSDRQYAVSMEQANKLKAALGHVHKDNEKHERLRKIEAKALESQVSDIEREIADYELLKSGSVSFTESFSLGDLPRVLIQARIAQGLSQTDLAERLRMKPQQVQRYEATEYMSASLSRIIEVADALHVRVSQSFSSAQAPAENALYAWSDAGDVDWSRFPLREMAKRGWIRGANLAEAARSYFFSAAGPQFATALHRKKVRSGNAPDEFSLLAWQARVLEIARIECEAKDIGEFQLNDSWLSELVVLTRDHDGPIKARECLKRNGIVLVVEPHLPGTYLDGAAMLSPAGHPVVALTLRYDRLDNFWFVLFHELGHVFLHLFTALRLDFFDEEDGTGNDYVENEADKFALDRLIPEVLWKQCLSRFALTEEAILIDAERIGVDPSIIAGRIRKERGNYQMFNNLIGSGSVRSQFWRIENDSHAR
ncbi:helix-turn-helix domain-containing protein [Phreatobacter stygius]|uniref:Helix-turn-helix domain-containing protein n=1 Tax=Phreatobacter stygius TaxID=1940610 RepID=A0A4D7AYR3_9HYPH|nr:XRE family transcriptional regulator [Phreatobacter stygius]QCI63943.1 helix-turn-helix domain-containing protein [Phreatobacter stygius]